MPKGKGTYGSTVGRPKKKKPKKKKGGKQNGNCRETRTVGTYGC